MARTSFARWKRKIQAILLDLFEAAPSLGSKCQRPLWLEHLAVFHLHLSDHPAKPSSGPSNTQNSVIQHRRACGPIQTHRSKLRVEPGRMLDPVQRRKNQGRLENAGSAGPKVTVIKYHKSDGRRRK